MKDEIIKCYWCHKIVELRTKDGLEKQHIEKVHGIVWEFGYSYCGWGRRQNFSQGIGEVCTECFEIYSAEVKKFDKLFSSRKGINNPKHMIVNNKLTQISHKKNLFKKIFNIFLNFLHVYKYKKN